MRTENRAGMHQDFRVISNFMRLSKKVAASVGNETAVDRSGVSSLAQDRLMNSVEQCLGLWDTERSWSFRARRCGACRLHDCLVLCTMATVATELRKAFSTVYE